MAAPPRTDAARRVRARVTGVVQGVGFRPYVLRLAEELGLRGWVLNDERGVELEVEGDARAIDELLARLPAEAPPLAAVDEISAEPLPPAGDDGFRIVGSRRGGEAAALVAADAGPCERCLAEIADPADRRHRYPFTNCTDCGPRFTIVRGVPYDRPRTTMAGFEMCARCRAEYEDPRDRRFHAQPNACPECGPAVRLVDAGGSDLPAEPGDRDPIEAAARLLCAGVVVAVKGVGGYHLACLAADERAVGALRARKHREAKPFALLAADLGAARELVELTPAEQALLTDPRRPIVIARRRGDPAVAAGVAPGRPDLGVMLPPSPLHHLLAADVGGPLVLTSGNVSDEPIAYRDADALQRLDGIADAFLVHDRPIETRTDDSVLRSLNPGIRARPLTLRRSRGYVPEAIAMPVAARRPLLGCGAELKSTFCIAKRDRAWVGHHIGDLKNFETLTSFREGVAHFERLFAAEPAIVAHDLHPDYLSSSYAAERESEGLEAIAVQHHHAHLAAVLAEHGERGPAVGAVFDGSGLGPDGTVWGGEILVGGLAAYERVGFILPVRLPGGDAAVHEPWRMACAWLAAAQEACEARPPAGLSRRVGERRWEAVRELVTTGVGSPVTTSAGRLFDAVAALAGGPERVAYEGQAAIELEAAAGAAAEPYPLPVLDHGATAPLLLDPRPAIGAICEDLAAGATAARVSAGFHEAVAAATARACALAASRAAIELVVLSGGVFQNRLLVERTTELLRRTGLRVLLAAALPPNDGAISFGQVAVAAAIEERDR
ncbi:MAG TPA: carbamoyltransferase HypF [Solirubrobacterales bacterium]|nr:carbamoyltransferase HypF [Solirubrobacterales bacterium]